VQNDEITLSTAEKVASMNVVKEMMVVGKVEERTKRRLMQHPKIRVFGEVHRKRIPELLRQANLYLCLEINPPCPNAVIEALATGLPVLGFDTGALKELVSDQAGCVVPYDADPWKLEMPNFSSLTNGFDTIYRNLSSYAEAARARAVNKFDIRDVTKEYINFALIQGSSNAT
jgi:glycosyltransferase involved in cell wall biosynthesis